MGKTEGRTRRHHKYRGSREQKNQMGKRPTRRFQEQHKRSLNHRSSSLQRELLSRFLHS